MDHELKETVLVSVPVMSIAEYEHNYRQSQNPKSNEIKESIRHTGLQTVLNITKLPGQEHYTIARGGNTRLRCMQALYKETGDDSFSHVLCQIIAFNSHADLMASHFIENESRADTLYVEKARIVIKILDTLKETGDTHRSLSEKLKKLGVSVHFSSLYAMEYTTTRLSTLMPVALWAGMGRPTVQKLQVIEKAVTKICVACGLPVEVACNIMSDAMELSDSERFRPEMLSPALQQNKTLKSIDSSYREKVLILLDMAVSSPNETVKIDIHGYIHDDKQLRPPDLFCAKNPTTVATSGVDNDSEKEGLSLDELRRRSFEIVDHMARSYFNIKEVRKMDFGYGFCLDTPEIPYRNQLGGSFWYLLMSLCGVIQPSVEDSLNRIHGSSAKNLKQMVAGYSDEFTDIKQLIRVISCAAGVKSEVEAISLPEMVLTTPSVTDVEHDIFIELTKNIRSIRKNHGETAWLV